MSDLEDWSNVIHESGERRRAEEKKAWEELKEEDLETLASHALLNAMFGLKKDVTFEREQKWDDKHLFKVLCDRLKTLPFKDMKRAIKRLER